MATHLGMVPAACRIDDDTLPGTRDHRGTIPLDLPELYTQYFDLVWRNLRRLGVAEASLDDAVQDVFLVVYRRRNEFLGQSSLKTWIVGIVLRVAHDYRRSHARHSARVARLATHDGLMPASSSSPAEHAEMREAAMLVREILEQFDEQERNAFVLIELEELNLREAAEAMGLSLSTCQRRLSAARKSFETALARRRVPAKKASRV